MSLSKASPASQTFSQNRTFSEYKPTKSSLSLIHLNHSIPKLLEDAAYQEQLPVHPELVEGQAVHGSTGLYVITDF